jgi:hypothetical protein
MDASPTPGVHFELLVPLSRMDTCSAPPPTLMSTHARSLPLCLAELVSASTMIR